MRSTMSIWIEGLRERTLCGAEQARRMDFSPLVRSTPVAARNWDFILGSPKNILPIMTPREQPGSVVMADAASRRARRHCSRVRALRRLAGC
jgi:hypothetical protein